MKRIINTTLAGIVCLGLFSACEKERNGFPSEEGGVQYIIEASLGESTKTTFNDGESISWAIGDAVRILVDNNSTIGTHTISNSSIEGNRLTFNTKLLTQESKFVVLKAECNKRAFSDTQIRFFSLQTQDEAGKMNDTYIALHSPVTEAPEIKEGQTSVTIPITMNIIGSIFRFIPYTTKYGDESVISIQFTATDGTALAGEPGVMGKDYTQPELYRRGDGKYDETCRIYWANGETKTAAVETRLSVPLNLDGITNAESSKGIYMNLPAVSIKGYRYTVTTDKAVYTFDASEKSVKIAENELKNIKLNLDKATSRTENQ